MTWSVKRRSVPPWTSSVRLWPLRGVSRAENVSRSNRTVSALKARAPSVSSRPMLMLTSLPPVKDLLAIELSRLLVSYRFTE